jgi:hypothetical protein
MAIALPELLTPREAAAVRRTTTGHRANEWSAGSTPDMQTRRPRFYLKESLNHITERITDPSGGRDDRRGDSHRVSPFSRH